MILADPSLWRIVWKEYRAQRSFWLAVAGFGVGLMLLLVGLLDLQGGRHFAPWAVAWLLPAFYALGSAAVLFASEQEDGTVELLRVMSARPSRVFLGKLGFCIVSTLGLYAVLIAAAAILAVALESYRNPNFSDGNVAQVWQWALWIGGALLPWGLFFSTVNRKVLTAACLGACAPFVARFTILAASGPRRETETWAYADLLLAIPLVALSYVAAARTLTGRTIEWKRPRMLWILPQSRGAGLKWLESTDESLPAWRRLFSRLLWIEFRQALTLGHALWIGGIYLALFAAWVPNRAAGVGALELEFVLAFATIPLFMGVWTFQAEGGQRVRYLAEQGINPAVVWLSKQIVWLFMTLAATSPFVLGFEIVNRQRGNPDPDVWLYCTTAIALGYAAGQFASMLVPRAVTAGFVGAVIYALLVAWMGFMTVLHVPFAISVVPVVVILLAATLAWSRNWLLERATWRSWVCLAAFVSIAFAAVWGSVGTYRLAEVPAARALYGLDGVAAVEDSRRFLNQRRITVDEAETARMYERATQAFRDARLPDRNEPQQPAAGVDPADHVVESVAVVDVPQDDLLPGAMAFEGPVVDVLEEVAPAKTAIDGWEFATTGEQQTLEENREVLELALAATRRTECAFFDPSIPASERPPEVHQGLVKLANLILLSARELESQDRFDEALNRYVAVLRMGYHVASWGRSSEWWVRANLEELVAGWLPLWATHPGQSAESIAGAATTINLELARLPTLSDAVAVDQVELRRLIQGDWAEAIVHSSERGTVDDWSRTLMLIFRRIFPWEERRALAVADLLACSQMGCAQALQLGLAVPGRDLAEWKEMLGIPSNSLYSIIGSVGAGPGDISYQTWQRWQVRYRDVAPWKLIDTTFPLMMLAPRDNSLIWHMQMRRELFRRSLLLKLGLIAWKADQGEYPTQLEQLPQDRPEVMLDPYCGLPFEYRRYGLPNAVKFANGTIQQGVPVFWSGGSLNARVVPVTSTTDGTVRFDLTDAAGQGPRPPGNVPEACGFALP